MVIHGRDSSPSSVGKDIRHCRATNARDHAKIMAALKGSEDLVNRKIRERMEDTVQFVKALS